MSTQVRLSTQLSLVANLNIRNFCHQFSKKFWREFYDFCENVLAKHKHPGPIMYQVLTSARTKPLRV